MFESSFWKELQKRKVVHAAAIFVAVAWGATEIIVTVVEQLFLPQWVSTVTVIAFVVGFPVEGGPDARYARPRSERIRLDTLVDGYTINGAYQLGRSHELGSIEVGKQADLVILNQNLFDVNRYDVHKTRPVAVIMDGELVHGEL